MGDEAGKGCGISLVLGHDEEVAVGVDAVVEVGVVFAKEFA